MFSAADAALASHETDEKKFDIFMTRFLTDLFTPLALVNSEDFRWMRLHERASASDQDAKPDFFIAPVEFVDKKFPSSNTATSAERERERADAGGLFRFGVPANWRLRDFVRVLESKVVPLRQCRIRRAHPLFAEARRRSPPYAGHALQSDGCLAC